MSSWATIANEKEEKEEIKPCKQVVVEKPVITVVKSHKEIQYLF